MIGLLAARAIAAGAQDFRNALAVGRIGFARNQPATDEISPRPREIALSMMSATTPRSTFVLMAGSSLDMMADASSGDATVKPWDEFVRLHVRSSAVLAAEERPYHAVAVLARDLVLGSCGGSEQVQDVGAA